MGIAIAIDGPAGAGKSTIAKQVASRLGFVYVDTGAMYRAVTLACLREGFDPSQDEARTIASLKDIHIRLTDDDKVFLNGEDVSAAIRTPEVSKITSPVSAFPKVRAFLVDQQRALARDANVLMDGRDIGTNVLPFAQVKIFMSASPKVRAHRRYEENLSKGLGGESEETIEKEIVQRDYNDSHRAVNPMRQAEDAVFLDTSDLSIDEVVDKVLEIVSAKTGAKAK